MKRWFSRGIVALLFAAAPVLAQQTGSLSGRVTTADGEGLPGVSVTATSEVLPQPRQAISGSSGEYQLGLLPPGNYELAFELSGMSTQKRSVTVMLQQNTAVDASLSVEAVAEEIEVVAQSSIVDPTSSEINVSVTSETIEALPVGQDYRDLVKLIPGVQYTEDAVRGPAAGGSGQDNTYLFDGVNVTLPLFGTLSAEPASHDIEQVAVVKGGADAQDFNRAGGFFMNSVSRSGTNVFHGMVSYQVQPESLTADRDTGTGSTFAEDKDWLTANLGGPIVKDRLYFYASYFPPTVTREARENLYGRLPDFDSERDEYFGKLTYAATDALLFHASYRTSDREESGAGVSSASSAPSTSTGNEATLDIGIFEASWVIDANSYFNFRYTDFENETLGRPDLAFGFEPVLDGSMDLDINALDTQGQLVVPTLGSNATVNAFLAPYINRYGFIENGVPRGGGRVGGGLQFDSNDFFREAYQATYDRTFGTNVIHELHFGYQRYKDEEDLLRTSNGWGSISIPGGATTCPTGTACAGQPIFFQAGLLQQGITLPNGVRVPTIHSEYHSDNFEINDSIRWGFLTVNAGLMVSNDTLYGQGLGESANTPSGFQLARGNRYEMYELDWSDMLQPRVGATWAYSGPNTVYVNYARYIPAASSLPRAASWARNSAGQVNAFFDRNGNFIGVGPEAASSGKFFQEDLDPRTTDEFVLGTSRDFGKGWSARGTARYRYSYNFWEDTNNNARLIYDPPAGIPRELYIPNLTQLQQGIGGSSYVIAELDRSHNKYWEAALESEWRGSKGYFRGSYVWSHYYGNMDQDSSAGAAIDNDLNIFIGSSNIADGGGRQLWNFKEGDLRGDRRHQLKLYGYYRLPWNASVGAYAVFQSGQPWEEHNYRAYPTSIIGTSTSDTNRYAEPAGSRNADDHHQLDLNYTQDFPIGDRFNIQARVDVFNVYDNQTGYDIQYNFNTANFGVPQSLMAPRRIQLGVRFEF